MMSYSIRRCGEVPTRSAARCTRGAAASAVTKSLWLRGPRQRSGLSCLTALGPSRSTLAVSVRYQRSGGLERKGRLLPPSTERQEIPKLVPPPRRGVHLSVCYDGLPAPGWPSLPLRIGQVTPSRLIGNSAASTLLAHAAGPPLRPQIAARPDSGRYQLSLVPPRRQLCILATDKCTRRPVVSVMFDLYFNAAGDCVAAFRPNA